MGLDDGKIRKRVGWLNTSGGFSDGINADKILEAARGLDVNTVMHVLKDLQNSKEKVKDPTAYATSALRKAGGGGKFGSGNFIAQQVWPQAAIAAGCMPLPTMPIMPAMPMVATMSVDDDKLRKRIGWLNRSGGFENGLKYGDIAKAAIGVGDAQVMKVLKELEGNKETVRDPTAYVVVALRKAARSSGPMYSLPFAPPAAVLGFNPMPAFNVATGGLDQKIRKRVAWLNSKGGFDGQILYEKVAEAAAGLDTPIVLTVLKNLEGKKGAIKDPTAWVGSALRKVGGGKTGVVGPPPAYAMPPAGYAVPTHAIPSLSGPMDLDTDHKLRKRVGWLNSRGGFDGKIIYQKIADAAAGVAPTEVMHVLKEMENNKEAVRDPTAYAANAIRKRRFGAISPAVFSSPKGVGKVLAGAMRWMPKGVSRVAKTLVKKKHV